MYFNPKIITWLFVMLVDFDWLSILWYKFIFWNYSKLKIDIYHNIKAKGKKKKKHNHDAWM